MSKKLKIYSPDSCFPHGDYYIIKEIKEKQKMDFILKNWKYKLNCDVDNKKKTFSIIKAKESSNV